LVVCCEIAFFFCWREDVFAGVKLHREKNVYLILNGYLMKDNKVDTLSITYLE